MCIDATVGEREHAEDGVDGEALGKRDDTVRAELVVVELQDLNLRLQLRVQGFGEELAAQRRDIVIKELQECNISSVFQVLADGSDSLILAEGLPEANRGAVLVFDVAEGVHDRSGARPAQLRPNMEAIRDLLLLLERLVLVLDDRTERHF